MAPKKCKYVCFPLQDDKFIVCGKKGAFIFYGIREKTEVKSVHPDEFTIEDAQWHPTENYLLVAYIDGTIKMFECDKPTESIVFERQGVGTL